MSRVLCITKLQPTSSPSMENTTLAVGTRSGGESCGGRGYGCNSFPPCPYCGRSNHPVMYCWQKFGKPPTSHLASAAFSIASFDVGASPATNDSVLSLMG